MKAPDTALSKQGAVSTQSGSSKHSWLESALPVDNSWEAVVAVAENAEDILEPEDFEGDHKWLSARIPIQWGKPSPSIFETVSEWNERLNSLRSMPPENVIPIILFMDSYGKMKIIDGYHRIALAIERGCGDISALVRCTTNQTTQEITESSTSAGG